MKRDAEAVAQLEGARLVHHHTAGWRSNRVSGLLPTERIYDLPHVREHRVDADMVSGLVPPRPCDSAGGRAPIATAHPNAPAGVTAKPGPGPADALGVFGFIVIVGAKCWPPARKEVEAEGGL